MHFPENNSDGTQGYDDFPTFLARFKTVTTKKKN